MTYFFEGTIDPVNIETSHSGEAGAMFQASVSVLMRQNASFSKGRQHLLSEKDGGGHMGLPSIPDESSDGILDDNVNHVSGFS